MANPQNESAIESPRDRILKAFIELVAEGGFAHATYRALSERADVSVGTVQHYFPKKERLVSEGLLHMHNLNRRLMRPSPSTGAADAVEARVSAWLPSGPESRKIWPFYIEYWAAAARDTAVRDVHVERWQRIEQELREMLIGDEVADGIPPAVLDDIVATLIALEYGLGVHSLIHPVQYPPARARRLLHRAFRSMLACWAEGAGR